MLDAEPSSTIAARLRRALASQPNARRFIVHGDQHPPFEELVTASNGYPVSVVATRVADTCKEVVDGVVRRTIPRETLVDLTGPWIFSREGLEEALARVAGRDPGIGGLVALSRLAGLPVRLLSGPWSRVWMRE